MGETRELRQKLEAAQAELRRTKEHLEKLRVHQAQERDSMRQELELVRNEVEVLRDRLRMQEEGAIAHALAQRSMLLELAAVERSGDSANGLVALVRPPSSQERALPVLSRVLNLAPVDVRLRLAAMMPAVVARLPFAQAQELRAELRAEGFLAVSCAVPPRGETEWVTVKRFVLEEQGLRVEGTRGEELEVHYADLRLLMKGRRIASSSESSRRGELTEALGASSQDIAWVFSPRREEVENFLWVLGKGARLVFTQPTHFNGLGALRAASVFENLQRLASELHRRAPHTMVDGRFLQTTRFTLSLVDQDRSHELMAELLFQAIEEGMWT